MELFRLTVAYYRADDLIPEENDTVLLALKRLPPKEAYDRVYRLRRAVQVSSLHPSSTFHTNSSDMTSVRFLTHYYPKKNRQSRKMYQTRALLYARVLRLIRTNSTLRL